MRGRVLKLSGACLWSACYRDEHGSGTVLPNAASEDFFLPFNLRPSAQRNHGVSHLSNLKIFFLNSLAHIIILIRVSCPGGSLCWLFIFFRVRPPREGKLQDCPSSMARSVSGSNSLHESTSCSTESFSACGLPPPLRDQCTEDLALAGMCEVVKQEVDCLISKNFQAGGVIQYR